MDNIMDHKMQTYIVIKAERRAFKCDEKNMQTKPTSHNAHQSVHNDIVT